MNTKNLINNVDLDVINAINQLPENQKAIYIRYDADGGESFQKVVCDLGSLSSTLHTLMDTSEDDIEKTKKTIFQYVFLNIAINICERLNEDEYNVFLKGIEIARNGGVNSENQITYHI